MIRATKLQARQTLRTGNAFTVSSARMAASITLPVPDDFHLHLRDGPALVSLMKGEALSRATQA
jgi:hypothetical protein